MPLATPPRPSQDHAVSLAPTLRTYPLPDAVVLTSTGAKVYHVHEMSAAQAEELGQRLIVLAALAKSMTVPQTRGVEALVESCGGTVGGWRPRP